MKNIPEKIYLNLGEDCPADVDFRDLSDVTWSDTKVFPNDIEYARKTEWVSVNERLPDKGLPELMERVLICERVANRYKVFIGKRVPFNDGWEWNQSKKENVVAWMPLPALPQTNKEKDE